MSAPLDARADYDPELGGWTEVITCPASGWDGALDFCHPSFYWGGTGPNIVYISGGDWWDYASPGVSSTNCGQWVNGSIVGGATYEEGEPSVPQDVDVTITTFWWDFYNTDFTETCGHQHAATYVWGWRYNGNSWSFEFVTAHQRTSYVGDDGNCYFQAQGNPDYVGFEAFAFGPETLSIPNSPYAVLYTKTQATSHYGAGCGEFECFHRVRVAAGYQGGPGVNKGKVAVDTPTNDLTIGRRPTSSPQLDKLGLKQHGSAQIGADARLASTVIDAATSDEDFERRLQREPELACRISFEQTAAAVAHSSADVDTGDFPPLGLAPVDVFLHDCLRLPPVVQKCQVFRFVAANYAACVEARREYDAQVQLAAAQRRTSR